MARENHVGSDVEELVYGMAARRRAGVVIVNSFFQ
jgi:hypothetical protein